MRRYENSPLVTHFVTLSCLSVLAITCNFDVSMCGFLQDKNDKFDWTRHKGATLSSGTGPSGDHTTGKGKLIKVDHFQETVIK